MACRHSRRHRLAPLALVVSLAMSACASGDAVDNFQISGTAKALPSSQLATVDSDAFQGLLLGLRGRPVLVNIWASWCVPCRAEAPILRRAAAESNDRVTFVGVASRDDLAAARSFLDEFAITYPNVFDPAGDVPSLVGMRGYPTTIAIDRSGRVRGSSFGGLTENRLAALLAEIR